MITLKAPNCVLTSPVRIRQAPIFQLPSPCNIATPPATEYERIKSREPDKTLQHHSTSTAATCSPLSRACKHTDTALPFRQAAPASCDVAAHGKVRLNSPLTPSVSGLDLLVLALRAALFLFRRECWPWTYKRPFKQRELYIDGAILANAQLTQAYAETETRVRFVANDEIAMPASHAQEQVVAFTTWSFWFQSGSVRTRSACHPNWTRNTVNIVK